MLNNFMIKAYVGTTYKLQSASEKTRAFLKEERGASDILALIIVLGIVLAIGFAFRKQVLGLVGKLWDQLVVSKDLNPDGNVEINTWAPAPANGN